MALRVLLADESSTIKKVFQLALQDYAVEVKPVHVGIDVISVAEKFQPDIIFADVLLQKRNGYDVSAELKQHGHLAKTPVVLMWSGFMDLDEDKFQASGADDQLEKPFDVKALRNLVQKLVPKTHSQNLSQYLSFPKLPDFAEDQPQTTSGPPKMTSSPPSEKQGGWTMEHFEPPPMPDASGNEAPAGVSENFQTLDLKSDSNQKFASLAEASEDEDLLSNSEDDESQWQQKDFSQYRVDDAVADESSDVGVSYVVPDEQIDTNEILGREASAQNSDEDEIELDIDEPPAASKQTSTREAKTSEPSDKKDSTVILNFAFGDERDDEEHEVTGPGTALKRITAQLNQEQLEEVIRNQSKEVIEAVVWKVIPELATQIIERELKRILEEQDFDSSQV